jgi:hypothetical protein
VEYGRRREALGENDVASIIVGSQQQGDFLYEMFDRDANSNECHLSSGDSSGALFILDGSVWKLAGIHYAVDGPFKNGVNGTMFLAAQMDRGGLFQAKGTNWTFVPNSAPRHSRSVSIASCSRLDLRVVRFACGKIRHERQEPECVIEPRWFLQHRQCRHCSVVQ